jgi:hypothetical protein
MGCSCDTVGAAHEGVAARIWRARLSESLMALMLVVAAWGIGCSAQMGGEPLLLNGTVADSSGRPVADARVAIVSGPVEVSDIAALTDEDGRFSIAVPVAGTYRVAAFSDEGRGEETVNIQMGHTPTVRLVLQS